jgi:hypothetical protein
MLGTMSGEVVWGQFVDKWCGMLDCFGGGAGGASWVLARLKRVPLSHASHCSERSRSAGLPNASGTFSLVLLS